MSTQESDIKKAVDPRMVGRPKIKVVGVGGGGCNAVTRMYRERIAEVEYISVNTDAQALARCQTPERVRVGDATARGLGVGGNPEKGRKCHEEDSELIREKLDGADMVFVAAGMGGGTGTGGAPVVAKIAKEVGALCVGVVTKPFSFEGTRRARQARLGIEQMADIVDTVIVIPNDKLLVAGTEDLKVEEAFRTADDVLKQGVQSIAELILTPGEINLDFADVKAVMSNAGQAWMAIGRGYGENRALDAAAAAIESPLLDVSVEGAKGVIFNITGGENLTLDEVNNIASFLSQIFGAEAHVYFGTATDPKMDDEVRLTVIATGFPFSNTSGDNYPVNKRELEQLASDTEKREIPPFMRNQEDANKPVKVAVSKEATEEQEAVAEAEEPADVEAVADEESPVSEEATAESEETEESGETTES